MKGFRKYLEENPWMWIVLILGVYVLVYWTYAFVTRFETDIIVEREITKGARKTTHNLISSKDGRIFQVQNHALVGFFNSAEVLVALEHGKKYRVRGYGRRIPILGLYPQITKVVKEYK